MKSLTAALATLTLAAGCVGSPQTSPAGGDRSMGVGPITLATGKVATEYLQPLLDQWNATHPNERAKLLELPEATDDQRAQMVNNLRVKSDRYDVLNLDVVWTAEFADAGWIIPLNRGDFPLDRFLTPVVDTALFRGQLYAVPYTSNAGLLYYRRDILDKEKKSPPKTWAELSDLARTVAPKYKMGGYAGQFQSYEGLTVNFAEAVQSAGGAILTNNGTDVVVNSPQARAGLNFLVGGLREGWIPKAALGYKEEESRKEFEAGHLLFLRNWPYVYGAFDQAGAGNAVKGRFGVVTLPGSDASHPGSSSLGGANLAISSYSKHQKSALEFIRYLTSLPTQRRVLTDGSFPPVWASLYDDPALIKRYPYLPVLKESILAARPRPQSPNYNQVSLIVSNAVYGALALQDSTEVAIMKMDADLKGAIVNR
jgi:multiple sugar transport system substrate-binding protein